MVKRTPEVQAAPKARQVPPVRKATRPKYRKHPLPVRLTCMLSFWNEDPADVEMMIASIRGLADRLVAYDGAYNGTPDATPSSSPALHKRIRAACKRAGIELELVIPKTIFKGETEKRNAMMKRAAKNATWVFPADSDWLFCGDREGLRKHLSLTYADTVHVGLHTPALAEGMTDIAPHAWHLNTAGRTVSYPIFHRVLPNIRVEGRHWWYLAEKSGKTISLHGQCPDYPRSDRDTPQLDFLIEHRCFYRDPEYLAKRKAFYDQRDDIVAETGVEP